MTTNVSQFDINGDGILDTFVTISDGTTGGSVIEKYDYNQDEFVDRANFVTFKDGYRYIEQENWYTEDGDLEKIYLFVNDENGAILQLVDNLGDGNDIFTFNPSGAYIDPYISIDYSLSVPREIETTSSNQTTAPTDSSTTSDQDTDSDIDSTETSQVRSDESVVDDTSDAMTSASNPPVGTHTVDILVYLFGEAKLLKGITEEVSLTDHTLTYQGVDFNYDLVESISLMVSRNQEFTDEFANEIADAYPEAAGIGYSTALLLLGASGFDSAVLSVAGADGNYLM